MLASQQALTLQREGGVLASQQALTLQREGGVLASSQRQPSVTTSPSSNALTSLARSFPLYNTHSTLENPVLHFSIQLDHLKNKVL